MVLYIVYYVADVSWKVKNNKKIIYGKNVTLSTAVILRSFYQNEANQEFLILAI